MVNTPPLLIRGRHRARSFRTIERLDCQPTFTLYRNIQVSAGRVHRTGRVVDRRGADANEGSRIETLPLQRHTLEGGNVSPETRGVYIGKIVRIGDCACIVCFAALMPK